MKDLKELSSTQQLIKGIIRIESKGEVKTFCIEDLAYTSKLSVSEAFKAIRIYYGKLPKDYGLNWVNYRNSDNEVSNRFLAIKEKFSTSLKTDLDRLQFVCKELGENPLPVVSLEETKKNLEAYKSTL